MANGRLEEPTGFRRMLPAVYVACGVVTLVITPNIYGTLSGVLFIGAGALSVIRPSLNAKSRNGRRKQRPQGRSRPKELLWEEQRRNARKVGPSTRNAQRIASDGGYSDALFDEPDSGTLERFKDGDAVPGQVLSRFSPFDQLPESLQGDIADRLSVSRKPAGTSLIERGSREDLCIYLLHGTLQLEAADGKRVTVKGGTSKARSPLCQLRPHVYKVKSVTDVAVLMLSQTLVSDIVQSIARHNPGTTGIQVHEVPEDSGSTSARPGAGTQ